MASLVSSSSARAAHLHALRHSVASSKQHHGSRAGHDRCSFQIRLEAGAVRHETAAAARGRLIAMREQQQQRKGGGRRGGGHVVAAASDASKRGALGLVEGGGEGLREEGSSGVDVTLRNEMESLVLSLQESICHEASESDGSGLQFIVDNWQRREEGRGGYGITRVLEGGQVFEKAAANVSIVKGQLTEARAQAMSARGRGVAAGAPYFAAALSLVFHPQSPFIPTFRSDIRFFQVQGSQGWFGGGADLTPCYVFEEDAVFFHSFYKSICDKFDSTLYRRCKQSCDEYFFLPTRNEHRGIGGIFFDDLESLRGEAAADAVGGAQEVLQFVREVGGGFMASYLPLVERRRGMQWGQRERDWQLLRRGRYLEFNLLHDRGVRFGLSGGRMESIMVSAPPLIAWRYNVEPTEDSPEASLIEILKSPRDWV